MLWIWYIYDSVIENEFLFDWKFGINETWLFRKTYSRYIFPLLYHHWYYIAGEVRKNDVEVISSSAAYFERTGILNLFILVLMERKLWN